MQCQRKEAILLLFLNALFAHCETVLKPEDETGTGSLLWPRSGKSSEALNYQIKVYLKECDCGIYGLCHYDGRDKCDCAPSTGVPTYGKCEGCMCGVNASTSFIRSDRTIICSSDVAYIDLYGYCEDCNCSYDDGWCRFDFANKCLCIPQFTEKDGRCVGCDCGEGGSCHLNSSGHKICNCFSGYLPYEGYCMECDCDSRGTCSFETGQKKCICDVNYAENDGKCEYCSCGENSNSCHFKQGKNKKCNCSSGYAENQGYCEECNCGSNGSCSFVDNKKRCNCKSFTVERNGECVECNCGPYGSCSFVDDKKRCDCKSFTVERNGVCVVMEITSLEDTTVVTSTALSSTALGKQDPWMISQFSVASSILILLSFMFCFWTRILNKISKN